MILGGICTRSCQFCDVPTGRPLPPDPEEPEHVATMLAELGLRHTVITCVDRDDLADGGAAHWAETIRAVKRRSPEMVLEVLTGDFKGDTAAVDTVLAAGPDVFAHNLETVPRLSRQVRVQASYPRSYAILRHAKNGGAITKTGLMLGLGEELDEVRAVLRELRAIGVDILTLGQYLRPSPKHLEVARFVPPGGVRPAQGRGAGARIPPRRVRPDGPLQLPRRRPARHRPRAGRALSFGTPKGSRAPRDGLGRAKLALPRADRCRAHRRTRSRMIPYFSGHLFDVGGWTFQLFGHRRDIGTMSIYMFGVLVAIGVIIGDRIVVAEGAKRGLAQEDVRFLNARIVIVGFIVAHLVSVIFYFPERIVESPWVLLNFWSGLSSFGGFLGAFLAFLFYTKREKIPRLPYADSVALGLSVGWIFGRTGCFTAHDHPGRRTSFFLAVNYPGGPRHDLGLDELLFTIVMTAILFAYSRKPPAGRPGDRPRGAHVRPRAVRPRFPAGHRLRQPSRPALRRADARAVGLPGDAGARREAHDISSSARVMRSS